MCNKIISFARWSFGFILSIIFLVIGTLYNNVLKFLIDLLLINLINNAVKFTDKGEIVVKAWTQHVDGTEMLFFSIKDSGMGIAPEKQALIFKPFEQIADVESRSVGGAGLGLAICAELLARMHGSIDLTSRMGEGSTFTISVYPGDISEVERQVLNFSSGSQLQTKSAPCKVTGRVLVVDDLRDLRMLVGHMISSCGARVDYAEHGQQALEKVRIAEAYRSPYDIIFIDIHETYLRKEFSQQINIT